MATDADWVERQSLWTKTHSQHLNDSGVSELGAKGGRTECLEDLMETSV